MPLAAPFDFFIQYFFFFLYFTLRPFMCVCLCGCSSSSFRQERQSEKKADLKNKTFMVLPVLFGFLGVFTYFGNKLSA